MLICLFVMVRTGPINVGNLLPVFRFFHLSVSFSICLLYLARIEIIIDYVQCCDDDPKLRSILMCVYITSARIHFPTLSKSIHRVKLQEMKRAKKEKPFTLFLSLFSLLINKFQIVALLDFLLYVKLF